MWPPRQDHNTIPLDLEPACLLRWIGTADAEATSNFSSHWDLPRPPELAYVS
jgi:hypothetical protein